jgi:hypothetical protein
MLHGHVFNRYRTLGDGMVAGNVKWFKRWLLGQLKAVAGSVEESDLIWYSYLVVTGNDVSWTHFFFVF